MACSVTGDLILIEIQIGKEGTNKSKYNPHLGVMEACTKIMTEENKGIGYRDMKGYTNDCFIFYSCFSSKKLEEYAMDVGADMIGMVKTNTKGYCKEITEKLKKD